MTILENQAQITVGLKINFFSHHWPLPTHSGTDPPSNPPEEKVLDENFFWQYVSPQSRLVSGWVHCPRESEAGQPGQEPISKHHCLRPYKVTSIISLEYIYWMQGPTTKDRIGNYDGQGEGRIPERQLCRRVPKEQGLYRNPGTYGQYHWALLEDGNDQLKFFPYIQDNIHLKIYLIYEVKYIQYT